MRSKEEILDMLVKLADCTLNENELIFCPFWERCYCTSYECKKQWKRWLEEGNKGSDCMPVTKCDYTSCIYNNNNNCINGDIVITAGKCSNYEPSPDCFVWRVYDNYYDEWLPARFTSEEAATCYMNALIENHKNHYEEKAYDYDVVSTAITLEMLLYVLENEYDIDNETAMKYIDTDVYSDIHIEILAEKIIEDR